MMKITTIKNMPLGLGVCRIEEAEKWLKLIQDGKAHKVSDIGKPADISKLVQELKYIGNKYGYLVQTRASYKKGIICFQGFKRVLD